MAESTMRADRGTLPPEPSPCGGILDGSMSLLDATTALTERPVRTGSQDSLTGEAAIELRTLASYVLPPYVRRSSPRQVPEVDRRS